VEPNAEEDENNGSFRKGSGTILAVDDEKVIREFTKATLAPLGYQIITAESGRDALRICEETEEKIDLLLTDVVMPGLTGPELAGAIQEKRPGIKILFMTGYTDSPPSFDQDNPDTDILLKPLTPESLAEKVEEMLNGEK